MAKLRLTLLGGFEARTESGSSLSFPRKKAQMLLAYLAMHPRQTHLRDKLATLLWDDAPAEQARQSLRQTLFAIRQAFPSNPMLLDGDGVAVAPEAVMVDVGEFERLALCGNPEDLERAAALYQGDLLEGLSPGSAQFEEWLRGERERLHELALEAFAKLLAHQMKLDAAEPAIQTALRLLSLDPLQEVTHRALMRLYAREGRRAAALRQYQLCVDVLQRELSVEPEEATQQVYRELLPQPSPRLAAPQADPHPLTQAHRRRLRAPRRSQSATTPLIGRDAEVDRLTQALARACASHGQAIVLLGEAGIGKTRLVTALREATSRRGAQALIGQSYETERLLPFGPWVQAIREAGIVEGRALGDLGAGWIAELSHLFPELRPPEWPLPSEPIEARRLFDAMTELVKSLAVRQPLLLVLEDLHWADEISVRLFAFLGRRLEGRRILLVGTAREEELDGASPARLMLADLAHEERLVRLDLAPLSQEHTRMLVRNLAEGSTADESSLTRLEDRVWTLSEGNPFVIVESLREVLGTARRSTLPDLPSVPEKVRELILGRFELLSDAGQHLLATAAVIGRDFEFRLLHRAADVSEADAASAVEALVRTHILHSVGERFDFTHDRIREVAYGRLLPTRRRRLHAHLVAALEDAVPDAVETVQQDRFSEHIEQLAYHAVRGDLREKAVPYLRQAGLRAAARSALQDARAWFEQALGVIETLPASPSTMEQAVDIRVELQPVLEQLGELRQVLERMRQAEAVAEQLNDDRRRGQVCAHLMNTHMHLGELDEARRCGTKALEIARVLGDLDLKIVTTGLLEAVHYHLAEYERVVELAKANLAALPANRIYDKFERPAPASVFSRHSLVISLIQLGRFSEAAEYQAEEIRIAEPTHHAFTLGLAHFGALVLHFFRGDWTKARVASEHTIAVLRSGSVAILLPSGVALSAQILAQLGETSAALSRLQEGEQLLEHLAARGIVGRFAFAYCNLGQAALLLGRLDEAWRMANRVVESFVSQPGATATALHLLGDIGSHPDRFDAEGAEANYRKALALAEPRGMRPLVARCHLGLGRLYRRANKLEQSREYFATATTMYREMGVTYWLQEAEDQGLQ
jgi:DNA-binding SARP family transcriptional activator